MTSRHLNRNVVFVIPVAVVICIAGVSQDASIHPLATVSQHEYAPYKDSDERISIKFGTASLC